MKRIVLICTFLVSLLAMGGCSDDIDSTIVNADEYPRVLGRWPDKNDDGTPGSFETPLNKVLAISLQYTPAEYCEGIWYLDGREIHRGVGLEYVPSVEGTFNLKLIVKTPTQQTSREAIIKVTPAVE